jgi:hypothetical protein
MYLSLRQEGTRQDGEGGVFGPGDANLAVEPLAAPNEKFIHLN